MAHRGGYRNRTHDPDPGNRLSSAALGHEIGHEVSDDMGFADGKNYAPRRNA